MIWEGVLVKATAALESAGLRIGDPARSAPGTSASGIGATPRATGQATRSIRNVLMASSVVATIAFGAVIWRAVESAARSEARAEVTLIRDYTQRLVETQNILLRSAQGAVTEFGNTPGYEVRAHRFLASLDSDMNHVVRLALVAPDGDFLLNSTQFPAAGNVGFREYVSAPLAGSEPFIDRLVIQPENRDVLIISRASTDAANPGVWNSAFDIEAVTGFLSQVSRGQRDAASLLREDGKVLARHVDMPEALTLERDHPLMQGIAEQDSGTYITRARSDGIRRFYAFERVGDLPLFAVAGVSRSGIFLSWLWKTALFAGGMGIVSLAVFQFISLVEMRRAADLDRLQRGFSETLLHELNHRVKNSLTMISGLIRLERRRPGGPDLEAVNARVMALAKIHDLLHRSNDSQRIDLLDLVREICGSDAVVPPERGITLESAGSPVMVDDKLASPIAFSLIELVTNAQKHAFDANGGRIDVTLQSDGTTATVHVVDNGRGMSADRTRSSGLRIVEALVKQIEGRLEIDTGPDGTRASLFFPVSA